MTRREQLQALRDRLANATHGTFALECELAALLTDWTPRQGPPRNYSVSIDAAVGLVPEGCEWLRKSILAMTIVQMDVRDDGWGRHFDAGAATPALALCLARLDFELAKEQS